MIRLYEWFMHTSPIYAIIGLIGIAIVLRFILSILFDEIGIKYIKKKEKH